MKVTVTSHKTRKGDVFILRFHTSHHHHRRVVVRVVFFTRKNLFRRARNNVYKNAKAGEPLTFSTYGFEENHLWK